MVPTDNSNLNIEHGESEFLVLLLRYLDDQITPVEWKSLSTQLAQSAARRRTFVRFCYQAKLIAEDMLTGDPLISVDCDEPWSTEADADSLLAGYPGETADEESYANTIPTVILESPTYDQPLFSRDVFIGSPIFSYIVATIILGVMILGAWMYKTPRNGIIANALTPSSPSDVRPQPAFVGQITGMTDCRWADPNTETYPGASVSLGRQYALSSGLLEITYKTGAKVILEGPCVYIVHSDAGGYLALGKLAARIQEKTENKTEGIKPSAFRLPAFVVKTPTVVITDLGTEFGVEVDPGSGTEVHVFRGEVEAQWIGQGSGEKDVMHLTAGKAASFDKRQMIVRSLLAQPQKFPRTVPQSREPVNVAARKTIVACSGVYGSGSSLGHVDEWANLGRFSPRCVINGVTDESTQEGVYWLGRERTPNEFFIIDLWGRYEIERIELINTHNSRGNDRGTQDFEVWAADEINGDHLIEPRLVLDGRLPCRFGAGDEIPPDIYSAEKGDFLQFRARYIKFIAKTYHRAGPYGGCGLNEIRVFAAPSTIKGDAKTHSPADGTQSKERANNTSEDKKGDGT